MNVYQRISAVMQDVSYLNKDAFVPTGVHARTGENKGYYALTAEKVLNTLRPLLVKHRLAIIPCEYTIRRTDESLIGFDGKPRPNRMTELEGKYRIQNIDDPDDYVIAVSCGQGADAQDKGTGKAMTYSYKYLLTTLFAIPSGEDPDRLHSDAYTDDLLSGYAPQEKAEEDTAVDRERLQEVIIGLLRAKGREDSDAEQISGSKYGVSFYDLTVEQLVQVKLALARGDV